MELCIYHGIKVQVENLDGECISQICRCTGSQSWRSGYQRNNWVLANECPGRCNGVLNGPLPWKPQQLFKINLLNADRAFVEYWLALGLATSPENSGNLDRVSKFVQLRTAPAAVALHCLHVGNIVSCAHVIPEIATRSKAGDGPNEQWIVHIHTDLAT